VGKWIGGVAFLLLAGCSSPSPEQSLTREQKAFQIAANKLPETEAAAKKAGIALTSADLDRHVDPASNAAPLYLKAFAIIKPHWQAINVLYKLKNAPLTQEEMVHAASLMDSCKVAVDLIETGASKPNCAFARRFDRGMAALFPELADLKWAGKLLHIRARLRARHADYKGAANDLLAICEMGIHAGQDRGVIPYLVEVALRSIALDDAQLIISDSHADPNALEAMDACLRAFPPLPNCSKGLKDDTSLLYISLLTRFHRHKLAGVELKLYPKNVDMMVAERAFTDRSLEVSLQRIQIIQNASTTLQQKLTNLGQLAGQVRKRADPTYLVADMVGPDEKIVTFVDGDAAKLIATHAGIEMLRIKNRQGSMPSSLPADVPPDPFWGNPLRLRLDKQGLIIYSIGMSGWEDGSKNNLRFTYPYRMTAPKTSQQPTS
jgi:hypothetical protein